MSSKLFRDIAETLSYKHTRTSRVTAAVHLFHLHTTNQCSALNILSIHAHTDFSDPTQPVLSGSSHCVRFVTQ